MSSSKILCLLVITHAFVATFASTQVFPEGDIVIQVPLYNQNNTFYYGEMQIGTPPQSFKVMFDTGVLGIIVPSTLCTNDLCQPHARYDANLSSTYVNTKSLIEMGSSNIGPDYACSGGSANDTITLGGVLIPNIAFMDVSDYTGEDFKDAPFDVICGLQFDDPTFPTRPLFAQLNERGQLADSKFAVSLTSEPGDSGSFFILGGYDTSKAPRGFDYYDVYVPSASWMVEAEDFGLGNTSYAMNKTIYLGIDIALESTYGGAEPMQNIISALGTLDCSHILHYPDFYVTIQGTKYLVPPSNYIFGSAEGCELGLKADQELDVGLLVLGNHFIKSHYTVFDFGSNQIGIAKPAPHDETFDILQ